MAATAKPPALTAQKLRKYRRLRIRLDGRSLEERASRHYHARVRERSAFSPQAQTSAYLLIEVVRFLDNLMKSRGPLFYVATHPATGKQYLQERQLATPFARCIELKLEKLKEELPDHIFHPALEIFSRYQRLFPYREALLQPAIRDNNPVAYAEAANQIAEALRLELGSKAHQQRVNAFIQATNRNYRALMAYIELLYTKASTLWVIRLDLGYASALNDYDVVQRDREKFLRSLRRSLPVGEPFGYAWKLERTVNKSWRHHFLFFFKPQKGTDAAGIAEALGQYWNTTITKDQGAFLNCNALLRGAHRRRGTGAIGRTDFTADSPLEQAVWYMTQLDYYIKLRPDRKWKTFFGGNKRTAADKKSIARRPRKPSTKLVHQIQEIELGLAMPRYYEESE